MNLIDRWNGELIDARAHTQQHKRSILKRKHKVGTKYLIRKSKNKCLVKKRIIHQDKTDGQQRSTHYEELHVPIETTGKNKNVAYGSQVTVIPYTPYINTQAYRETRRLTILTGPLC
jgi:hypothetical protein